MNQKEITGYEMLVDLIITDNEANTVENTLKIWAYTRE
jgi:hypothetical protein